MCVPSRNDVIKKPWKLRKTGGNIYTAGSDAADCKCNIVISSGHHPRHCKMEKLLSEAARVKIWKSRFIMPNFPALVKNCADFSNFQARFSDPPCRRGRWKQDRLPLVKREWLPEAWWLIAAALKGRKPLTAARDGREYDHLTGPSVIISAHHRCPVPTSFINQVTKAVRKTKWAKLDLWWHVSSTRSPGTMTYARTQQSLLYNQCLSSASAECVSM